jgi:uncharacterized membrane protein
MTSGNTATLPLGDARPGARLAAAVLGADGQVLMAAGTVLSEANLQGLARRGIASVVVEARRDPAELTAAREALSRRLDHLFRRCDTDTAGGAAQVLHRAALAYRLETLQ